MRGEEGSRLASQTTMMAQWRSHARGRLEVGEAARLTGGEPHQEASSLRLIISLSFPYGKLTCPRTGRSIARNLSPRAVRFTKRHDEAGRPAGVRSGQGVEGVGVRSSELL